MHPDRNSPVGSSAEQAAAGLARSNPAYRAAREEYARIAELRRVNPVAAHLRERRFELEVTVEQLAAAAGTTDAVISALESGTEMPPLSTLSRIVEALGEELLLCFQRTQDGEVEREFAPVLV